MSFIAQPLSHSAELARTSCSLALKIRPALETLMPQGENYTIGLTKDGRTVSWMREVQLSVGLTPAISVCSIAGRIAGGIIGAVFGLGRGLYSRDINVIINATSAYMHVGSKVGHNVGCALAFIPGALAGSIISSVVVPPVSSVANLVCGPYKRNLLVRFEDSK